MKYLCLLRSIHHWLILGGPYSSIMGHTTYEQPDGSWTCNWCDWTIRPDEIADPDDYDL